MKKAVFFIVGLSLVLFLSCGKKKERERLAKEEAAREAFIGGLTSYDFSVFFTQDLDAQLDVGCKYLLVKITAGDSVWYADKKGVAPETLYFLMKDRAMAMPTGVKVRAESWIAVEEFDFKLRKEGETYTLAEALELTSKYPMTFKNEFGAVYENHEALLDIWDKGTEVVLGQLFFEAKTAKGERWLWGVLHKPWKTHEQVKAEKQ